MSTVRRLPGETTEALAAPQAVQAPCREPARVERRVRKTAVP